MTKVYVANWCDPATAEALRDDSNSTLEELARPDVGSVSLEFSEKWLAYVLKSALDEYMEQFSPPDPMFLPPAPDDLSWGKQAEHSNPAGNREWSWALYDGEDEIGMLVVIREIDLWGSETNWAPIEQRALAHGEDIKTHGTATGRLTRTDPPFKDLPKRSRNPITCPVCGGEDRHKWNCTFMEGGTDV